MPELRLENSVVDDRYLVEKCLGRGSYAEIFLAGDHLGEGESVIIKSLNTSLQGTTDPELEETLIENFQNEAIALDRVRHPNIILRLGHGTAADLEGVPFHYLVLEYMPGGDLWSLCRNHPLNLDDALFYFKQVAEALAYAHSQRVIHRDIKPNNLLLSADRRVLKIADFGVAKMTLDEAREITRVGTNVFAPPEHHPDAGPDDLNEKLTPSADVYSLAKTIYTAMTGRAPRQFSRQPITELPEDLARARWSGALLAVLSKATAARVADRYQSVEEFWQGFANVQSVGDSNPEGDDEATIVRARLSAVSTVEQAAPRPDFGTLANSPLEIARQKARIVVDLPVHRHQNANNETHQPATGEPERRQIANSDSAPSSTRTLGSSHAGDAGAAGRLRAAGQDNNVTVATDGKSPLDLRKQGSSIGTRGARSIVSARMRALIRSEWLPRVFIVFLAAALIGLAASTYYHFADRPIGGAIFGAQTKDARIANAENVNLRNEPSGTVLATLPSGTRVRIVEQRGGWVKLRVLEWPGSAPDNAPDTGWVDARFVKTD